MRAPEMTSSWCLYREHISHLALVFLLLTLNMQLPAELIVIELEVKNQLNRSYFSVSADAYFIS